MENFVQSLLNRLDQNEQMQIICIMDNAINEMHNNGIISRVSPELAARLHDPDPNVRVTEKTSLAKSVGYSFVCSSEPGMNHNGVCHTIEVKNDSRFPNSIAICIQGGLEGLYLSGIYKKNKSETMDYTVIIDKNGQDSSALENNLRILNNIYGNFNIGIIDKATSNLQTPKSEDHTKESKKKNGFFAKLFHK